MYKLCSFRPEQSVRWKDSKLVVPVQLYIAVSSLTYIGCFKFQVLIGLFSLYEIKLFTKSSLYLLAAHSQTQFEPLKEMIKAWWMYSDILMSCDSTEETLGSSHGEQMLSRVFCPDTLQTKCAPCFGISEIGLIWWGQAEYLLLFLEGEGVGVGCGGWMKWDCFRKNDVGKNTAEKDRNCFALCRPPKVLLHPPNYSTLPKPWGGVI